MIQTFKDLISNFKPLSHFDCSQRLNLRKAFFTPSETINISYFDKCPEDNSHAAKIIAGIFEYLEVFIKERILNANIKNPRIFIFLKKNFETEYAKIKSCFYNNCYYDYISTLINILFENKNEEAKLEMNHLILDLKNNTLECLSFFVYIFDKLFIDSKTFKTNYKCEGLLIMIVEEFLSQGLAYKPMLINFILSKKSEIDYFFVKNIILKFLCLPLDVEEILILLDFYKKTKSKKLFDFEDIKKISNSYRANYSSSTQSFINIADRFGILKLISKSKNIDNDLIVEYFKVSFTLNEKRLFLKFAIIQLEEMSIIEKIRTKIKLELCLKVDQIMKKPFKIIFKIIKAIEQEYCLFKDEQIVSTINYSKTQNDDLFVLEALNLLRFLKDEKILSKLKIEDQCFIFLNFCKNGQELLNDYRFYYKLYTFDLENILPCLDSVYKSFVCQWLKKLSNDQEFIKYCKFTYFEKNADYLLNELTDSSFLTPEDFRQHCDSVFIDDITRKIANNTGQSSKRKRSSIPAELEKSKKIKHEAPTNSGHLGKIINHPQKSRNSVKSRIQSILCKKTELNTPFKIPGRAYSRSNKKSRPASTTRKLQPENCKLTNSFINIDLLKKTDEYTEGPGILSKSSELPCNYNTTFNSISQDLEDSEEVQSSISFYSPNDFETYYLISNDIMLNSD